jgi:ABC-type sugar transport system permease subunit
MRTTVIELDGDAVRARVTPEPAWKPFEEWDGQPLTNVQLVELLEVPRADLILIMTGGGPVNATTILTVFVYRTTFEFFRFGEGAAAAVLLMLIPLLFTIGYVRATRHEEAL